MVYRIRFHGKFSKSSTHRAGKYTVFPSFEVSCLVICALVWGGGGAIIFHGFTRFRGQLFIRSRQGKSFAALNVFISSSSDELNDDYLSTEFEDEQWIPLHCHSRRAACGQNQEKLVAQKKLLVTGIICLVFMIGELIGNILKIFQKQFNDYVWALWYNNMSNIKVLLPQKGKCTWGKTNLRLDKICRKCGVQSRLF